MSDKLINALSHATPADAVGQKRAGGPRGRGAISRRLLAAAVIAVVSSANTPVWAQSSDDLAKQYSADAMKQALQTKETYELYGLHFATDEATIPASDEPLLDDLAAALKNFPDWHLRIIGHTDATGDPVANMSLSLARAGAIKAALVARGIAPDRLLSAGFGQQRPVASNDTAAGKALNRRVELVRFTDSAEAKELLKGMSDYLAALKVVSFSYDASIELVTNEGQKLQLTNSGTINLSRPDKVRTTRSGGFADVESVFDGKTLTLSGKTINKYTQVEIPGSVDHLIDELTDTYGLPLPAADLLKTNTYDELMEGVYDSKDLGSGVVNGVECDSLAFRKDEVDFQIWVAQSEQHYPCRLVITSTQVDGGPQYSVQVKDWKTGDAVAPDDFTFANATNAEKVAIEDIRDKLGDMPGNFVKGDGK